jgi:hypothetical protein
MWTAGVTVCLAATVVYGCGPADRREITTEVDGIEYDVPDSVVSSIERAYADLAQFLNGLASSSGLLVRLTHEQDDEVWDSVLSPASDHVVDLLAGHVSAQLVLRIDSVTRQMTWIPSPDIGPMLSEPLAVNGRPIREVYSSGRIKPRAWAGVYCDGGEMVVAYAADSIGARVRGMKDLNPLGFVFVRYHEHAHILLDHVWCDHSGNTRRLPPDPALELAADCKATELLVARFRDGVRIVDNVHGQFDRKRGGGSSTHPPFAQRAANLYKPACGAT